jgi:hypothetical protein
MARTARYRCMRPRITVAAEQLFHTPKRLTLHRHGPRRRAIYGFACCTKASRGWPASAGHDGNGQSLHRLVSFHIRYIKAGRSASASPPCTFHTNPETYRPDPEPRTPLRSFAGLGREECTKVGKRGERSKTGEGGAARTALTRLAPLADLSREERERCPACDKKRRESSPAVLFMLAPAAYQPTSRPTRRAWDNGLLNAFEPAVCVTKLKSP